MKNAAGYHPGPIQLFQLHCDFRWTWLQPQPDRIRKNRIAMSFVQFVPCVAASKAGKKTLGLKYWPLKFSSSFETDVLCLETQFQTDWAISSKCLFGHLLYFFSTFLEMTWRKKRFWWRQVIIVTARYWCHVSANKLSHFELNDKLTTSALKKLIASYWLKRNDVLVSEEWSWFWWAK